MNKCTLCGFETKLLFTALDRDRPHDKTEHQLNWCYRCCHGQLGGVFTPEIVSSFYTSDYYTHSKEWASSREPTFLEKLRTAVAWRFDQGGDFCPSDLSREYKTVCDIGCGSGQSLRMFKRFGFETIGVEPDADARLAAHDAGKIFEGTAEEIPSGIGGFDVVLMSHVLEHCIDPKKAISNARDLLSPDGTLVVEVPNNAALAFSTFGASWPFSDIPRHLHFFTEKSLRRLFASQSLRVTAVKYSGFTHQFSPIWMDAQRNIWRTIRPHTKPPNFETKAWGVLLRTAFLRAPFKYYSVRLYASAIPGRARDYHDA